MRSVPSLRAVRNRRPALAGEHALDYMSMPSLLAWRSTCLHNYVLVNQHIRGSLLALLSHFFPDPTAFLQAMVPWSALIIGEAALSHVLHNRSICWFTLELAIGNLFFRPFMECISCLLPLESHLATITVKPAPYGFPFHRHISRIAEFHLTSGMLIVLYESSTPSACDVVSGYWTTALMNFVTAFTLGCAYPRLTFNRLSLLCQTRSYAMAWWDHDMANRLDHLEFEFNIWPDSWPLVKSMMSPSSPSLITIAECGKELYICPLQSRYFSDPGSLIVFFDGFYVDIEDLHDLEVAPYGPIVAWRIPSVGTCNGGCIEDGRILPPFITSMLTQFAEDDTDFVRAHEVLHTISNTGSRSPVILPPVRHRDRRYSM